MTFISLLLQTLEALSSVGAFLILLVTGICLVVPANNGQKLLDKLKSKRAGWVMIAVAVLWILVEALSPGHLRNLSLGLQMRLNQGSSHEGYPFAKGRVKLVEFARNGDVQVQMEESAFSPKVLESYPELNNPKDMWVVVTPFSDTAKQELVEIQRSGGNVEIVVFEHRYGGKIMGRTIVFNSVP